MKKFTFLSVIIFCIISCTNSYDSQRVHEKALKEGHPGLGPTEAHSTVTNTHSIPTDNVAQNKVQPNIATHYVAPKVDLPQVNSNQQAVIALHSLVQGNHRFMNGKNQHPNQTVLRRKELSSGQKPDAIVLSCSDSRVPPELVFDKGLGELFVVRTAGEVADEVALASIEYAVEHLHAKLIVVMGHSSCGAVKAALSTPEGKSAGSVNLDELVKHIRPAVKKFQVSKEDATILEPVKSNVNVVANSLVAKSKILSHAVEKGEVMVVQAVYNLESGKVDFWF